MLKDSRMYIEWGDINLIYNFSYELVESNNDIVLPYVQMIFFNIRLYESRFCLRSKIDLHISLINCLSDMLTIKIAIWVLQLPLTLHFWKIGFQQVIVQLCQVVILVVKNIKNIIMQGRLVLYRRMVDNGIQW